ncbi:MAG: hypothetical protein ABH822_00705 [Patescibacteria group bacterium]
MENKSTFSFWVVFIIVVLLFIGAVLLVYWDVYVSAAFPDIACTNVAYPCINEAGEIYAFVNNVPQFDNGVFVGCKTAACPSPTSVNAPVAQPSAPPWITVTTPDGSRSGTYYKEY